MPTVKKVSVKKVSGLSVTVYSLLGKAIGTLTLPKEIFRTVISKTLLKQAMRVYMTNQKIMSASTKSRGEINATKAKVYRQKGTGRARHGAKSAPIYVGGGRAFGPRNRVVRLELPKNMRKAALMQALSSKMGENNVIGIIGIEKATGKTKEINNFLEKVNSKNALIVTDKIQDNVVRAIRNIPGISILPANQINAYEVLRHQMLMITKEAVEVLKK